MKFDGFTLISISIVSHGQGELVQETLRDLANFAGSLPFEVILTRNLIEQLPFSVSDFPYPLRVIDNAAPKGFGANHNAAFAYCNSPFFCVMNPDVRLRANPFWPLIACMEDAKVGLAAPMVFDQEGRAEDSARRFPTPTGLASKLLGLSDGRYHVTGANAMEVDWVAGMFMFFRAEAFRDASGFDEDFFLYYEDADICTRLWQLRWKVLLQPGASIIHAAQRRSRRNPRYFGWHLSSMTRYFVKHMGRLPT